MPVAAALRSRASRLAALVDPRDLVAGVSVALVLVPQSLAYAQLAGVPAYRGLYAAALPPLAAALFASSPYLQTGPVALTSLLTFGALAELAEPGSADYVGLAILLALVVGVVRLAVGLARAGVIAYLMSTPMLIGFVPAAALLIIASQLPTALGADPPGDGVLRDAGWALVHPGSWEAAPVALAVLTIALVLVAARISSLFPAVLVAVVVAVVYSLATDYEGATVASVPTSFPALPGDLPWRELPHLVIPGVIIALVGFVEPASIARRFAALDRTRWDANREFVSQGVANLAAGVSGDFPVGGSYSWISFNRLAGARTRWSGAIAGLAVLAFIPFGFALEPLPTAVLAGIVVAAVVSLLRLLPLFRLWRHSKPQFLLAWTTFVLTLALAPHVERAVIVAGVLAVSIHLWRELSLDIDSWTEGETLHVRPRGVLWFGSARIFEDKFLEIVAAHRESKRLDIHLDGLGRFDLTGALTTRRLVHEARDAGLEVRVLDARPRASWAVKYIVEPEKNPLGDVDT